MTQLFHAARGGDRQAQSEIQRLIARFARAICGRGGPAHVDLDWEDVAQEAARRFFTSGIEQYRGQGSERSYLYTIVKATAIQIARSAMRRRGREEAVIPEPHVAGHSQGSTIDAHRILSNLSKDCRQLLARVYLYAITYRELAAELGMAESSVRSKVSRCLGKAREIAGGG